MSAMSKSKDSAAGSLRTVCDHLEQIDWQAVPSITPAEAAAFTARLDEAREECLEGSR